jgi:predicted P-loop ATPase
LNATPKHLAELAAYAIRVEQRKDAGMNDTYAEPPPKPAARPKKIEATYENLHTAVECETDLEFGEDDFMGEVMCSTRGADQWRSVSDHDYVSVARNLERLGYATPEKARLRDVIGAVAVDHRFDSAIKWLDSLPEHDGVARVGSFLYRYFGAEDNEYTRAVSSYIWTALAARILEPGCKADMAPVLAGRQGLGKSHGIASMCPSPDHFVEIDLKDKSADLSRTMRNKLIGELAELSGMHSRDTEHVKAFITRRIEEWVPKYRESTKRYPRRLLFIGTTNKPQFLTDPSGNRRWLPVIVSRVDVDAIVRDRDQLWAEARAMFRAYGVQWKDAERLAIDIHEDHRESDSWESKLKEWIDTTAVGPITTRGALISALGFIDREITKAAEMRVADCMRSLGYEQQRRRFGGPIVREWVRVTACDDQ